jgi:hypothetical protein
MTGAAGFGKCQKLMELMGNTVDKSNGGVGVVTGDKESDILQVLFGPRRDDQSPHYLVPFRSASNRLWTRCLISFPNSVPDE